MVGFNIIASLFFTILIHVTMSYVTLPVSSIKILSFAFSLQLPIYRYDFLADLDTFTFVPYIYPKYT